MKRPILTASFATILLIGCTGATPTAEPTQASVATSAPIATASPTQAPTPSPALTPLPSNTAVLLARGNFENKGASVELDATGEGSNVEGVMTMFDFDFSF